MYSINNKSISSWGLRAGVVGSALTGYALSGVWSLPKRLGVTHYDWQGDIEPYVASDDIVFDGRDLSLSLVCAASSAAERSNLVEKFCSELPNNFTLSHPVLGSFEVGAKKIEVKYCAKLWGELVVNLREAQPKISHTLAVNNQGVYGIDGYDWQQLGFIVQSLDGHHGLCEWSPLAITTDPRRDQWVAGYRSMLTITIEGTIKGSDYLDFLKKVELLQALMSAPGVRTVKHLDGSFFTAFCVDGFEIADVWKSQSIHMGKFTCKMIKL